MINLLSEAIQIQTTQDVNDVNMPKFHAFIEKSFPLVNKMMEKTIVGQSLVYKLSGDGDKNLLFCGHMDVVAANPESWECDPYAGLIKDGYVWGRGALDCKNIVIGLLCAMESLLEEGFKPQNTVYLAFGHDEEIGGPEGATQIVKMLKEQGVYLDLVLDEGGRVSTDYLPDQRCAIMALAEKNILRIKITAPDAGGHAAYMTGKTGLYRIAKAIVAIEENPRPAKIIPVVQQQINALKDNYPEMVDNFEGNPENNPFVRTTIAPTMCDASKAPNILPNKASFTCDIRILPGDTVEEILDYIKGLIDGLDLTIEILQSSEGECKATDFNAYYCQEVIKLVKEKFDATAVPRLMAGGTDSRHYQDICDVVIRFGPTLIPNVLSQTVHTDNERIPVEAFEKAVDFYKTFIKRHG